MKKILSTLAIYASLTVSAFGQLNVQDPGNLLGEIDQYLGHKSFEQAFSVGDSVELTNNECEFEIDENGEVIGYECYGETEEKKVLEVSKDYALFNGGTAIVRSIYERNKGNLVRVFLNENLAEMINGLRNQGVIQPGINTEYIRLDSLERTSYEIEGVGGLREAMKLNFLIVIESEDGSIFELPFYMTIDKDLPFMGQIAQIGMDFEIFGMQLPPSYEVTSFRKN